MLPHYNHHENTNAISYNKYTNVQRQNYETRVTKKPR